MLYDNVKIRKLRQAKKLSINELGRRSGISGPSMHAIETGKTKKVVHSTLVGIANALGVSMQEILKAGKGGPKEELLIEAMAAYAKLNSPNQQAMLAAIRALLDKQ